MPQVLEWAFQSDWTAYLLEHFSHFHFFSPCFLQKCFFIPVRSPRALEGWWWTQLFSGHTYTLFLTSLLLLCFNFHGKLCPLRWSCKFWSLWKPFPHISHKNLFVAISVFGDNAITSASGSDHHESQKRLKKNKKEIQFFQFNLIREYTFKKDKDKKGRWMDHLEFREDFSSSLLEEETYYYCFHQLDPDD